MPRSVIRSALLATALVLLVPAVSAAQDADKAPPPSFQQGFDMMGPMMAQMSVGVLQATLATLAAPESAEKLATFTRNYYEALIRKGFTKDEALRIVVAFVPPLTGAPR